jgi:hypothetical protein
MNEGESRTRRRHQRRGGAICGIAYKRRQSLRGAWVEAPAKQFRRIQHLSRRGPRGSRSTATGGHYQPWPAARWRALNATFTSLFGRLQPLVLAARTSIRGGWDIAGLAREVVAGSQSAAAGTGFPLGRGTATNRIAAWPAGAARRRHREIASADAKARKHNAHRGDSPRWRWNEDAGAKTHNGIVVRRRCEASCGSPSSRHGSGSLPLMTTMMK